MTGCFELALLALESKVEETEFHDSTDRAEHVPKHNSAAVRSCSSLSARC